jgi:hypothetical protein
MVDRDRVLQQTIATIERDYKAVERLVNGAAVEISKADTHFAGHSPAGRSLDEHELRLLDNRRQAVVILLHIRNAADVLLSVVGPEPSPFREPLREG